ncbi:MAG: AAA family ATPase [Clostridiales bacterium]|nr:AAA family ATPase [Clostridiales bacterium]
MKPFIIITGPQAVGKMAVGMSLREKYNYRLFHNHMTIELVHDLYGSLKREYRSLVNKLREDVFEDVVGKDLEGFVYTYMWGFNLESEHIYINDLIERFESKGWAVTIVELEADVDTRLERNKSELRLKEKKTKRNIEWSDKDLVQSMEKYRLNSNPGEITYSSYLRINNTSLKADEVADQIYKYIQKR